MLKINLVFRKPFPGSISIEYLFHTIQQRLVAIGVPTEKIELPEYSKGLFKRLKNTLSLLKSKGEIVHVTGDVYYAILGAVFSKRIITYHDFSFLDRTSGLSHFILKLFWVTLPAKFAHHITTVSQTTRTALLKEVKIDEAKVTVIENFIDPIFQPVSRDFNTKKPRILQVGTSFNKNLSSLIVALQDLNCTLVIIGKLEDPQLELLKKHQLDYENYHALNLEQLHTEYLKADLLTFISTVEGFGMPILEAQACGLPVVTSNVSAMPEVAGKGVILVNPNEIAALKKGIKTCIDNTELRNQLVAAGYENVKRFNIDVVTEKYRMLYQNLSR